MLTLFGAQGSMGRRYSAILDYLGQPYIGLDLAHTHQEFEDATSRSNLFIVATPTSTHEHMIKFLCERKTGAHILCEKPIVAGSAARVSALFDMADQSGNRLYCVCQYAFLPYLERVKDGGLTTYDYYNSGKDGLHWDCFQLYALAKEKIILKNESPVWKCQVNGLPIQFSNMDRAYVDMVKNFIGDKSRLWGRDMAVKATEKVMAAI